MTRLGLNLLISEPAAQEAEVTQTMVTGKGVRLERIVSFGQASPDGFWFDQTEAEWVMLLTGRARIRIADQAGEITLGPGDAPARPRSAHGLARTVC
jgi:cupin 2 domain-containing protein